MSSSVNKTFYGYVQLNNLMDKENITQDWKLVQSPAPVSLCLLGYLVFVLHLGPKLMASKKPYNILNVVRVYNVIQIVLNASLLSMMFVIPGALEYITHYHCTNKHPDNPEVVHLRYAYLYCSWHYFVLKLLDLCDTVFMVLRKKYSHITFLHIYHHVAMVFFTWYSNKYIKAPQATIPAAINSFVHCVMYFYYFLTTFGPEMQKYLWWKKYLTKLQLAQFAVVIAYLLLLYSFDCHVPHDFNVIWIINVVVIAAFFVNFYIQTYIIKPQSSQLSKSKNE